MQTTTRFTWLSLAAWLLSLCLPTMSDDNRFVFGVQLFIMGFGGLPFFLFFLIHYLSWGTNFLLLFHVKRILSSKNRPATDLGAAMVCGAIPLNAGAGIALGTIAKNNDPNRLSGLLALPGFYVWLLSFFFLAVAVLRKESRAVSDTSAQAMISAKFKWLWILAAPSVLLAILWSSPLADALKFKAFDLYCQSATETLIRTTRTDALEVDYWPYSGVMEDRYYPTDVARSLLAGPPRLRAVHLAFEMPRDKVVQASCAGKYVHVATHPDEVIRAVSACGRMTRYEAVEPPRYAVRYSYGKPNLLAIRGFSVSVQDTKTGEVLAVQRSYQLLLGSMNSRSNARWYGWGSAEGARTCSLTPPRQFILQAIGSNTDG